MTINLSIVVAVIACVCNAAGQVLRAEAGLVKKIDGEVLVHCHRSRPDLSELRKGEVLHNEDLILTLKSGSAVFSLNPDSYVLVSADTALTVRETALSAMRFDVTAGEVIVTVSSLDNGASLVFHAPPRVLKISKKGLYRVYVQPSGETQVNVIRGELIYTGNDNRPVRLTKGKQVDFRKRVTNSSDRHQL